MRPDFLTEPDYRELSPTRCLLIADYDVSAYRPADYAAVGLTLPSFLSRAVPKRQAEFLAGRALARRACAALGRPGAQIGRGDRGEPLWPDGVSGSISHSHGMVGVWVVRDGASVGLDIEAEADEDAVRAICHSVLTDADRAGLGPSPEPRVATAVFSAKEALYKALYPVCGVFFGFDHVDVKGATADVMTLILTKPLPNGPRVGQTFDICQRWESGKVISRCEIVP